MHLLTFVVWLATALGGAVLVGIWLQHGGMSAVTRRFPKPLPFLHALSAVISLVLFLAYWIADIDALRPIVLIGLLLTAILGFAMFAMWLGGARARTRHSVGAAAAEAPEDRFPFSLVVIHGIAAVATLVLYIATAYFVAT